MKNYIWKIILIVCSLVFTLPLLWLIDSPIKYFFMALEGSIILLFLYLIFKLENEPQIIISQKILSYLFDIYNYIASFVVFYILLSVNLDFRILYLSNISSLFITSFIPGFAIINLTKFKYFFSPLEKSVFGYFLSFVFTGVVWLISIPLPVQTRLVIFAWISFILQITSHGYSLYYKKKKETKKKKNLLNEEITYSIGIGTILGITLIFAFYIISYFILFPDFIRIYNIDMHHHYQSIQSIIDNPPSIGENRKYYFLSHFHGAILLLLSSYNFIFNQTMVNVINLFFPLAFYISAKRMLSRFNPKAPIIATLIFIFLCSPFGGFGWIIYAIQKFDLANTQILSDFEILVNVAVETNNSVKYSLQALWYIPMFTGTLGFLLLFNLMANKELPNRLFFILAFIIEFGITFAHIAEGLFFAYFVIIISVIYVKKERMPLNLQKILLPTLGGTSLSFFIYYIFDHFSYFGNPIINNRINYAFIIIIPALFLAWVYRDLLLYNYEQKILPKIKIPRILYRIFTIFIQTVLSLAILIGFIYATYYRFKIIPTITYNFEESIHGGWAPWFNLSLMGLNIIILSLTWIIIGVLKDKSEYNRNLKKLFVFSMLFFIFTILFGRGLREVNFLLEQRIYSEKRILLIAMAPLSLTLVFLPLYLINVLKENKNLDMFLESITQRKNKLIKNINLFVYKLRVFFTKHANLSKLIAILFIGFTVTMNFTIFPINIYYWQLNGNDPSLTIPKDELNALSYINSLNHSKGDGIFLTFSERSEEILGMSWSLNKFRISRDINSISTFYSFFENEILPLGYNKIYLYLPERDSWFVNQNNYLKSILSVTPTVIKESTIKIYNLTDFIYPLATDQNINFVVRDKNQVSSSSLNLLMLSSTKANFQIYSESDTDSINSDYVLLDRDIPFENITLDEMYSPEWGYSQGFWQTTQNISFIGGDDNENFIGKLYSAEEYRSFHYSVNLEVTVADPDKCNYVNFIYDYQDSTHFKEIVLNWNSDGNLYLQTSEAWPGLNLNISREFNRNYEIELVNTETHLEFYLDGNLVYNSSHLTTGGLFGFGYRRIQNFSVDFQDFSGMRIVAKNQMDRYLNYVKSGGNLVIMNSRGYGQLFANITGYHDNIELNNYVNQIVSRNSTDNSVLTYSLDENISDFDIVSLIHPESNYIIYNYSFSSNPSMNDFNVRSPFIFSHEVENGTIFYINIFPITNFVCNSYQNLPLLALFPKIIQCFLK